MKGDKKIFLPIHQIKTDYILSLIATDINLVGENSTLVIAIAGESGTGKTEIASLLQESIYKIFHKTVKVLHIDDYYKSHWKRREEIRLKRGIQSVGHKEISWTKLNKVIKRFRERDKQNIVKQIHMFTDTIEYSIVDCRKLNIIIIEGLYALYTKDFNIGIYLEGTRSDTYNFRKLRGKENPDDKFRNLILVKEAKEVRASRDLADISVPFNLEV